MEFKKIKLSRTFLVIFLAMVFGAVSGVLTLIIVGAGNFKIPFWGKLNYADSNLSGNVVIEQPRNVIVEQDKQLARVENDLLPAILNIYHEKKGTDPLSRAYLDGDSLAKGFILTADGWFVTVAEAVKDQKNSYVAVGYQSKKYQAGNFLEDKATGIAFGKVSGASNLPVAKLGTAKDLTLGQSLVAISSRNGMQAVNISKIGYRFGSPAEIALSSDYFKKKIFLNRELDESYNGGVLANFKGEVVGVIHGGSAIPVDYLNSVISQVLEKQKISRASLGVDYIDLSQVDGLSDLSDKGAYVSKDPIKGAAAYGLVKKGDLIKKVNDDELNAFSGLAEVINKYRSGDRVDLSIVRSGKEIKVSIVLK